MATKTERRSASGSRQYLAGDVPELVVNLVTGPLTLTNELAADGFIAASPGYISKLDLKGFTQVRLTGRIVTVSASANSPKLQLRYAAADTVTVGSFLIMGVSSVEFSVFTGTRDGDSGWIDLVPGAQIDSCYVGLMSIGGDGAADPVVSMVQAHFR